jgi:hypothetical protein
MAALTATETTLRAFTAPFSNSVGWRKDAERARSQLLHPLLAWWGVEGPAQVAVRRQTATMAHRGHPR